VTVGVYCTVYRVFKVQTTIVVVLYFELPSGPTPKVRRINTTSLPHLCVSLSSVGPERIELFVEDHAFLRSYDTAPRPPSPSPSPVSKLSLFLNLPVCRRPSLLMGWEGAGMEPKHTTTTKLGRLYIVQSSLCGKVELGEKH
jgi:hypothetical protein